jgi:hypothetical protein
MLGLLEMIADSGPPVALYYFVPPLHTIQAALDDTRRNFTQSFVYFVLETKFEWVFLPRAIETTTSVSRSES